MLPPQFNHIPFHSSIRLSVFRHRAYVLQTQEAQSTDSDSSRTLQFLSFLEDYGIGEDLQMYILIGTGAFVCIVLLCCILCLRRCCRKRKLQKQLEETNKAIRAGDNSLLPVALREATSDMMKVDSLSPSEPEPSSFFPAYDATQYLNHAQMQQMQQIQLMQSQYTNFRDPTHIAAFNALTFAPAILDMIFVVESRMGKHDSVSVGSSILPKQQISEAQ